MITKILKDLFDQNFGYLESINKNISYAEPDEDGNIVKLKQIVDLSRQDVLNCPEIREDVVISKKPINIILTRPISWGAASRIKDSKTFLSCMNLIVTEVVATHNSLVGELSANKIYYGTCIRKFTFKEHPNASCIIFKLESCFIDSAEYVEFI